MEQNKIYNINFLDNQLPDKCAQLIIADPPYFEVKGSFDFVWKSFDDYLKDVEKWAIECKRILSDNGTLFWWGDKKRIAYIQIILDKYFNLENSMIWRKPDSMQYQYYSPELARTFNTHNERLLMYSNTEQPFNSFAKYLSDQIDKFKLKMKDIQVLYPSKTGGLTGCVSNWINGENIITKEQYGILQNSFGKHIFNREYKDLINEYELTRRYFYNETKLEEVLNFSQESSITKDFDHPTKKAETITRALILTCSREKDLVVIPFAGSGTECAMSAKENRNFIGFDIESKYVEMANKRCSEHLRTQSLFSF